MSGFKAVPVMKRANPHIGWAHSTVQFTKMVFCSNPLLKGIFEMTGFGLLALLAASILLLIFSISKWKLHPFLALMGVSLLFALAAGLDLRTIADIIGAGFSDTFTSIGIVVILGALIGSILEKTGAALKLADVMIRLTGKKHPELALMLMGRIVSLAVFCDSAFVILDPIRKSLVRRTQKSSVACTLSLALGLYITQCFLPPAPGPVAAANALYKGIGLEADLILVMGLGLLCSLLPTVAAYCFARRMGRKLLADDEKSAAQTTKQAYEALLAGYGPLPGAFLSFAPILVPILLMAFSSAAGLNGEVPAFIAFLGKPVIALTAGLLMTVWLLKRSNQLHAFYNLTETSLQTIAPILFVIAAGGVLGAVISATELEAFISDHAASLQNLGLLFPFLLAALLKTALGSSTVAITTTAGILSPLMLTLGLNTPMDAAMAVCAIAAGSMTVCHANDSYFWVIVNLGGLKAQDGYRTVTLGTLVIGLAALLNVLLVSLIL